MTAKVKLGPVLPLHKVNPNAVRSFLILMMSRAHSPSGMRSPPCVRPFRIIAWKGK